MNDIENKKQLLDKSGMEKVILDFHQQIRYSISKLSVYPRLKDTTKINKVIIFGMGGSAISADLARNYISINHPEIELPITILRNYNLPSWVDSQTLAIGISYSGNTEETLSCITQAQIKTTHLAGIAAGGKLKELCQASEIPFIEIPSGYMPRAALGYLFFSILIFLLNNFCRVCQVSKALIEFQLLADFLENKGKIYSQISEENKAYQIAKSIHGKIPVIYSSSDVLDIVNLRFRGQIQENSKNLAFGNFVPEMNHNEINSFQNPNEFLNNFALIYLNDKSDNPKNTERLKAVQKLLKSRCETSIWLESNEEMFLVRLFDLIYTADWVSFYLALLNNEDPTPIPLISELKEIMSGTQK